MQIHRTRNAGRNIIFGIIQKTYQIIMPFIMRTVMIYYMGLPYAGLNNLFTSILQVLNLAELGIGAAMTYSIYEPIARDDTKAICSLLRLYRTCFRVIGAVVLLAGSFLIPFLPHLVAGKIPGGLNLYILYLMYLGNTVLSYWLFAYKNSLLYAHQRLDIGSKVVLLTNTLQYSLQLYILFAMRNYYLYLSASILAQVLTNILTALVVDKIYPDYHPKGCVDRESLHDIRKRVQGLVTNKIGSTILNSADSIVISAFLGLSVLAIYQNYFFIVASIISLIYILYQSCLAGIGNSLIVEESRKNYDDFLTMTFIITWVTTFCCCCFLCLFQPFMKMWMGKGNLLSNALVVCIVVYFYVYEIDQLIGTYKDAAGIWYTDRYRPLVTALVNLILSLMSVRFCGLYGVILSTVISLLCIGTPWMIGNLFHTVFKGMRVLPYITLLSHYTVTAVVITAVTYLISNSIDDHGLLAFLLKIAICFTVPNVLECLVYAKNGDFKRTLGLARQMMIRGHGAH